MTSKRKLRAKLDKRTRKEERRLVRDIHRLQKRAYRLFGLNWVDESFVIEPEFDFAMITMRGSVSSLMISNDGGCTYREVAFGTVLFCHDALRMLRAFHLGVTELDKADIDEQARIDRVVEALKAGNPTGRRSDTNAGINTCS